MTTISREADISADEAVIRAYELASGAPWGRVMFTNCFGREAQNERFIARACNPAVPPSVRYRFVNKFEADIRFLLSLRHELDHDPDINHQAYGLRVQSIEAEIATRLALLHRLVGLDDIFLPFTEQVHHFFDVMQGHVESRIRVAHTLARPWLCDDRFLALANDVRLEPGPLEVEEGNSTEPAAQRQVLESSYVTTPAD